MDKGSTNLVAEAGCLEADLRFAYIAHAGVPRFTDDLGLVDKLREKRRFEPDDIALFRAFLDEEIEENNAQSPLMNIPLAESYLMDRLFLAVLRIKSGTVLTTEELNALEKSAESRAKLDDLTLKIAGKVGVYFTEHFNYGAKSTSPSLAEGPITLFENNNNICPISVSVARAWRAQNREDRESLISVCAGVILRCMECTLTM